MSSRSSGPPSAVPATSPPVATPSGQPASPSQAPTSPAALKCRLPVASADAPIDGNPTHGTRGKGGFVTFPGASFAGDANSLGTYVLGAARWVPVRRSAVSADGKRYAWAEYKGLGPSATGAVHVVEVATGADRSFSLPSAYGVVDFAAAGIYLNQVVPASDAPATGLALLDPATGSLKQISADKRSWQRIEAGAAWAADLDKADPNPPVGLGPANRVVRLDLASGSVSTVFTSFGNRVEILGFDASSNPVLAVAGPSTYEVRVGSASVYSAPGGEANPIGPALADANGLWFGSVQGTIWLLPPGGTPRKTAETGLRPAFVAGTCN